MGNRRQYLTKIIRAPTCRSQPQSPHSEYSTPVAPPNQTPLKPNLSESPHRACRLPIPADHAPSPLQKPAEQSLRTPLTLTHPPEHTSRPHQRPVSPPSAAALHTTAALRTTAAMPQLITSPRSLLASCLRVSCPQCLNMHDERPARPHGKRTRGYEGISP